MFDEDLIKQDFSAILARNGLSSGEFAITIAKGSSYDPHQIVSSQVWITIERNSIKKQYGLYRANWISDFETDLRNGYFNP